MNFELPLTEVKVKKQQIIALHLTICFALIVTGILLLTFQYIQHLATFKDAPLILLHPQKWHGYITILAGIILLITVVRKSNWLLQQKNNRLLRILEFIIIASFAIVALLHELNVPAGIYTLLSIAIIYALFYEASSGVPLVIIIHDKGIKLPATSRKRDLQWWEVQKLILRHSVLTIDCYDNRLFQWNIANPTIDVTLLEEFSKKHIAANSEKHKKMDW